MTAGVASFNAEVSATSSLGGDTSRRRSGGKIRHLLPADVIHGRHGLSKPTGKKKTIV